MQLEINDPRLKLLQFTNKKGYSDPKYLKVPYKRGEIYASVSVSFFIIFNLYIYVDSNIIL